MHVSPERHLALDLVDSLGPTFLVVSPHPKLIAHANADPDANLYRETVNFKRLEEQHKHLVDELLRHVQQYGGKVVEVISSAQGSGNAMFVRDPIVCTAKGIVIGRLKEPVRKIETELAGKFLRRLKLPVLGQIEYGRGPQQAVLEGGDVVLAGDRAFICVGNRTNMEGVQQLMHNDWLGVPIVAVVHYPPDGNMNAIHLDCFFGLAGKKHAFVWNRALEVATVSEWRKDSGGLYKEGPSPAACAISIPLSQYLTACAIEIIPVNDTSQAKYACNFLELGQGRILTQETRVTQELADRGFQPIYTQFDEAHKMYGGIRCAVQTIAGCSS